MDFIIWRDSFNTSNEEIDNQHRELVRTINKLFDTLNAKNRESEITQIFLELFDYTEYHFRTEEKIMLRDRNEKYALHKSEHVQFKIKLNSLKANYLLGASRINVELLQFLKDWLLNHINKVDRETFTLTIEKETFNASKRLYHKSIVSVQNRDKDSY